jgi:CubicO group peptidase (beta-lactamase class C family)
MSGGGLSEARLATMREVLGGYVERGEVPGFAALVSRRGETHVAVVGVSAFGGRDPISRDSIFRIASMTKPITAVAALILLEECRLRLDEPIDRLLPELAGRKVLKRLDGPLDETVPSARAITVRDLLTFRMGTGIVMAMPGTYPIQRAMQELHLGQGPPNPQVPPEPDEWMRRLGTLPLIHQPGERWMYNTGSDVLGVLIARASGQPFAEFLSRRIFEPLGMKDTGFFVPADKIGRLLTGYSLNRQTGKVEAFDRPADGQWSRPPAFASGAGGLVSTLDDYLAFADMLLNKGRRGTVRLLSRHSVELMTSDQLTAEQKAASGLFAGFFDSTGWGFGVSVITRRDGVESVGTYGWNGGLGTWWHSDPAELMVCILLTQSAWASPSPPDIGRDFRTSAYAAIDD